MDMGKIRMWLLIGIGIVILYSFLSGGGSCDLGGLGCPPQ